MLAVVRQTVDEGRASSHHFTVDEQRTGLELLRAVASCTAGDDGITIGCMCVLVSGCALADECHQLVERIDLFGGVVVICIGLLLLPLLIIIIVAVGGIGHRFAAILHWFVAVAVAVIIILYTGEHGFICLGFDDALEKLENGHT